MAVFRIAKTRDYTVMSNAHFKERGMSLKAKGLLSLMLSLPDEWDYSIGGLVAICKENEAAVKSTLAELKKLGYLSITKRLPNETASGRIEYVYNIFEHPQKQEGEKQGVENQPLEIQPLEKQVVEKQAVENPTQLNTNQLTTNQSNTNESSIDVVKGGDPPDYNCDEDKLQPFRPKKLLFLSDNQIGDLLDKMGLDAFEEYAIRLETYIEETGARVKSHYATILKWYNEDRGVA